MTSICSFRPACAPSSCIQMSPRLGIGHTFLCICFSVCFNILNSVKFEIWAKAAASVSRFSPRGKRAYHDPICSVTHSIDLPNIYGTVTMSPGQGPLIHPQMNGSQWDIRKQSPPSTWPWMRAGQTVICGSQVDNWSNAWKRDDCLKELVVWWVQHKDHRSIIPVRKWGEMLKKVSNESILEALKREIQCILKCLQMAFHYKYFIKIL